MSFAPQNEADAFLDADGYGPRAASWKPRGVGDGVAGEIIDVRVIDATDITTGELKRNADNSPKKQLVVILQTDFRNWDAATPLKDQTPQKNFLPPSEDDGKRAIYAEQNTNRSAAIKAAVAEKGLTGAPKVGGKLWVKLTEERNVGKPSPLKIFAAGYQPPAVGQEFDYGQAPQQPQQQAYQPGPPAGQAPPAPPSYQGYQQAATPPQGFQPQAPVPQVAPTQQADPWAQQAQPQPQTGMQQGQTPPGFSEEPPF